MILTDSGLSSATAQQFRETGIQIEMHVDSDNLITNNRFLKRSTL